MNKKSLKKMACCISILTVLFLVSCAQPSPLNGVWADNRGDTITLMPDYSYTAYITNQFGKLDTYTGTYSVILNAIYFSSTSGDKVVSEWDIRGSMLYLTWPDSKGNPLVLTLYKTKN